MGVKFNREYEQIVEDLTSTIGQITNCYDFFEMTKADWDQMNQDEQTECLHTMADDIFFALGTTPTLKVGTATITHHSRRHVITVAFENNQVAIVPLI